MKSKKKFLAVIPARGGSKRLPRKNIKPLAGKPLIAWTLEAAKHSHYLDEVIVSTEDQEIARVTKAFSASVLDRPTELATDEATTFSVLQHAIEHYRTAGQVFDYIVLLQPTSPLRQSEDIDGAIELLLSRLASGVVTVTEAEHHPLRSNKLPPDRLMDSFLRPEAKDKTIQEMPIYYRLNGAVHIAAIEPFLTHRTFFLPSDVFAYVMPAERSSDIDTELDFALAEFLLSRSFPK